MRGGKREGAGRPKGARNRRSLVSDQLKREIAESGRDPVEYMLQVMEKDGDANRRLEAAKGAAPYLRPKLSQAEITQHNAIEDDEEAERMLASLLGNPATLANVVGRLTATPEQLLLTKDAFRKQGLALVPADGQVTHISKAAS